MRAPLCIRHGSQATHRRCLYRALLCQRRRPAAEALVHPFRRRPVRPRPIRRALRPLAQEHRPDRRSHLRSHAGTGRYSCSPRRTVAACGPAGHAAGHRRQPSFRHRRRHRHPVAGRAARPALPRDDRLGPAENPGDGALFAAGRFLRDQGGVEEQSLPSGTRRYGCSRKASSSSSSRPAALPRRPRASDRRATCRGRSSRRGWCRMPRPRSFRCISPARTAGCSISSAGRWGSPTTTTGWRAWSARCRSPCGCRCWFASLPACPDAPSGYESARR